MKMYKVKEGVMAQPSGAEALAAFAHDLRTPMCCVSGAAQMALVASRQGKNVDEQMQQILLAVDAMNRMLEQMCSAQREMPCTAQEIERQLRAMIGPKAEGKGQMLSIDLSKLYEAPVHGVGMKLLRVVLNLAGNAVKYTQEGGKIDVRGEICDGCACVFVRDNGMGMKKEFITQAFEPFVRARESAHLPGKGLGLSIVRTLVQELGGRISVRSAWGKGTEFCIRLPLEGEKKPS